MTRDASADSDRYEEPKIEISPYTTESWGDLLREAPRNTPPSQGSDFVVQIELTTSADAPPAASPATRTEEQRAILKRLGESSDDKELDAAKTVQRLLDSEDPVAQKHGRQLLDMLNDADKRATALLAIEKLPDSTSRATYLDLQSKPEMARASNRLSDMLKGDDPDSASELVRSLSSNVDTDRTDGARLLKMLNSNPSEQATAEKVLRLVSSIDQRGFILDLLELPQAKKGAEKLLDSLNENSERKRQPAEEVLSMLTSNEIETRQTAVKLVKMLGGDAATQETAQKLLKQLGEPERIAAMLTVIEKNKDASTVLMSWLDTKDSEKRVAAKALLDLEPDRDGNSPAADALLRMLADPKQVDEARAILSIDDPEKVATIMKLRQDKDYEAGVAQLTKMLGSKTYSDKSAAANLVNMLDGNRPDSSSETETGNKLLKMLGEPAKFDTAKTILHRIDTPVGCTKFLTLADRDTETATRLLNYISTNHAGTGLAVLQQFREPKEINKFLDIIGDRALGSAAHRLRNMLSTGGANALVEQITSADPEIKKSGEAMLRRLNESRTFGEPVESILNATITAQERQQLMAMRNDPEKKAMTALLIRAAENSEQVKGVGALLSLLRSDEPKLKPSVESLASRIVQPENRELAQTLLANLESPSTLLRFNEMLTDEKQKPAVDQLLRLMRGSEEQQQSARNLMSMLDSGEPGTKAAGDKLAAQLNSTDAIHKTLARNVLDQLKTPQEIKEFLELTDRSGEKTAPQKALADRLVQIMTSANFKERRGVNTLMAMAKDSDGLKLKAMLSTPSQQADATTILSTLTGPSQVRGLIKLLDSPKHARAANELIGMLREGKAKDTVINSLLDGLGGRDGMDIGSATGRGLRANPVLTALVDRLSSAQTSEAAKKLLTAAETQQGLFLLAQLSTTTEGKKTVEQLQQMLSSPAQRGDARTIIDDRFLSEQGTVKLVALLNSEKDKETAAHLITMLSDDETGGNAAASQILDNATLPDPAMRRTGERVLAMLADPEQRALAEQLSIRLQAPQIKAALSILDDKRKAFAANAIRELILSADREESRAARTLLTMLASSAPTELTEGRRLLEMLNTDRHRSTAIRILHGLATRKQRSLVEN